GPRRERLAHPRVEFVLGQHALHERGLQRADHLLTVGVRSPQAAVTSCACCYLVTRSRHAPRLPTSTMHRKRSAAPFRPAILRLSVIPTIEGFRRRARGRTGVSTWRLARIRR